jgi:protein-S-isoprenylcysteine O-methyltransferase
MASLAFRRHMMPGATMAAFVASVLPAGRSGLRHLALGVTLLAIYWLVEWRGIEGTFEGRVPRRGWSKLARAAWLAGLVLCIADGFWLHWTPWQGRFVRAAGVVVFLGGVALRLWSMRALSRAFSYDIKVVEGQELVRRGPYRLLRHPSYTGLLLWSAGFALWNPSLPGFALLVVLTVEEVAFRIRVEERVLEEHFGDAWRRHVEATWAVVPMVW